MAAGDRSRASNCSWVLAGANFIALRRRGVMVIRFLSLLDLYGAKHSSSGGPLRQSRGVEASLFVNYLWSTISLASSHDSGRGGAESA